MKSLRTEKRDLIAISVLCLLLSFLFLADPQRSADELRRGLLICAKTLIPTLFPFMVISELLIRSGLGSYASKIFSRPMRILFGVSGAGAAAFALGVICGFPVGAKSAAALCKNGEISREDAESLMTFCNLPSAPFMIFAVGEKLFGSRKLGILLYLISVFSALIYAVLRKIFIKRKKADIALICTHIKAQSAISVFTDSVTSAASSVFGICAYVSFFCAAVGSLSGLIGKSGTAFGALIFSFFELTSGAAACAALSDRYLGAVICSAAAGWSGLSVFFQIYSLTRTSDNISLMPYISAKAVCSAIGAALTATILKIFPSILPAGDPAKDIFLPISLHPGAFIHAANAIFILSLIFYLIKLLDRRLSI